jgi:hypothetical protein
MKRTVGVVHEPVDLPEARTLIDGDAPTVERGDIEREAFDAKALDCEPQTAVEEVSAETSANEFRTQPHPMSMMFPHRTNWTNPTSTLSSSSTA